MAPLIRICAATAAAVVLLSFALFVIDESSSGSKTQVDTVVAGSTVAGESEGKLGEPAPAPAVERVREQRHSSFREYIDDGNDIVVAPFTGLVASAAVWPQRLVTTALALLLFGFGGLLLANMLPRRAHEARDWRESSAA